jgi:hypothetical protein
MSKIKEPSKIYAHVSPEEKLNQSLKLYFAARELKRVSIKTFNPELTDEEVEKQLKVLFKREGN